MFTIFKIQTVDNLNDLTIFDNLAKLAKSRTAWKAWKQRDVLPDEQLFKWHSLLAHKFRANKRLKDIAMLGLEKIMTWRWGCSPLKPVAFTIPYSPHIDRQMLHNLIAGKIKTKFANLPNYVSWWHQKQMRITIGKSPAINNMLVNHTQIGDPNNKNICRDCKCDSINATMKQKHGCMFPTQNGHICFAGKDYQGPHSKVVQQNAKNIPHPSLKQSLRFIQAKLQKFTLKFDTYDHGKGYDRDWDVKFSKDDIAQITNTMHDRCKNNTTRTPMGATTFDDVTEFKKLTKHLTCSTIDKNNGMLLFNCGQQHLDDLKGAFAPNKCKTYSKIYIRKMTATLQQKIKTQIKNNTNPFDIKIMLYPTQPHPNTTLGDWRDIKKFWRMIYRHFKWDNIAGFNEGGTIKASYLLYKFKHVGNKDKMHEKTRVITPFSKHPMRTLLRAAARAWMFILKKWKKGGTILHSCQQLQTEVDNIMQSTPTKENISIKIWDIDGFFPSMPKEDILTHMSTVLHETTNEHSNMNTEYHRQTKVKYISVPRSKCEPTHFSHYQTADQWNFTHEDLMNIVKFCIDNCLTMVDGCVYHQNHGVPMGDPLSPPISIATAAVYEKLWAKQHTHHASNKLHLKRYVDDVIGFAIGNEGKDLANDFIKNCYPKELSLTESSATQYLETNIHAHGNRITMEHNNKNYESLKQCKQDYYKVQRYDSFGPKKTKTGVLIGEFTRIAKCCNTLIGFCKSIKCKLYELHHVLKYPKAFLTDALEKVSMSRNDNIFSTLGIYALHHGGMNTHIF